MRPLILAIEDDPDVRLTLVEMLQSRSFRVAAASNGQEALRLLREGEAPVVILLDLLMPVMNGWQFRRVQLADARLAAIPVIVLSGGSRLDEAAASLGASVFLHKPVCPDELVEALRRCAVEAGPSCMAPVLG